MRSLFYTSNASTRYLMKRKIFVAVHTCNLQLSVRRACLCVCNVYGMDGGAVAKQ